MATMAEKRAKLEARLAAVEERLAALEGRRAPAPAVDVDPDRFWALAALQERLGGDPGAGAVVYTGAVTLPTGEHYVWQQGADVEALLGTDADALVPALAALGHRIRLLLLLAVLGGRRTVAELEGLEGFGTTGQLYHHLRQLTAAGWLQAAGRGRYAVPAERVVPLLLVLAAAGPAPPSNERSAP
jgi:hypothetical protein